jgi:hypothetical protein
MLGKFLKHDLKCVYCALLQSLLTQDYTQIATLISSIIILHVWLECCKDRDTLVHRSHHAFHETAGKPARKLIAHPLTLRLACTSRLTTIYNEPFTSSICGITLFLYFGINYHCFESALVDRCLPSPPASQPIQRTLGYLMHVRTPATT